VQRVVSGRAFVATRFSFLDRAGKMVDTRIPAVNWYLPIMVPHWFQYRFLEELAHSILMALSACVPVTNRLVQIASCPRVLHTMDKCVMVAESVTMVDVHQPLTMHVHRVTGSGVLARYQIISR